MTERIQARAVEQIDYLGVKNTNRDNLIRERFYEDSYAPYYTSFIQYMSKTYGCPASRDAVDSTLKTLYEKGLTDHIRNVLDREKISLVQCAAQYPQAEELPLERSKWAFYMDYLVNFTWAEEKSEIETFDQVIDYVLSEADNAIQRGCTSFKNALGYTRNLDIEPVSYDDAREAFVELWKEMPFHFNVRKAPEFSNNRMRYNLKRVQDYLLKQLLIKCGKSRLSFQFHTGGGLSSTDIRNCNPLLLYGIFYDKEVLESGVKFVLLHASVPYIGYAAIAANSFPHVYVDVSWPVRTEIIDEALRTILSQVSPTKILYGSDANTLPDRLGLSASAFRRQLAVALREFQQSGFSDEYCMDAAEKILNGNAKQLMKID
ncbi:MAG: amidohydrolase [Thaumarchaeota archaeon]|nr:amidohydrolase [Nitrososphaerota archaeon]